MRVRDVKRNSKRGHLYKKSVSESHSSEYEDTRVSDQNVK